MCKTLHKVFEGGDFSVLSKDGNGARPSKLIHRATGILSAHSRFTTCSIPAVGTLSSAFYSTHGNTNLYPRNSNLKCRDFITVTALTCLALTKTSRKTNCRPLPLICIHRACDSWAVLSSRRYTSVRLDRRIAAVLYLVNVSFVRSVSPCVLNKLDTSTNGIYRL